VADVGTPVKEGDVLATVNSLAGPMAAVRATVDGIVKTVMVKVGEQVQQGTIVVVLETK
jgi:biotin carboxyl carrier protein